MIYKTYRISDVCSMVKGIYPTMKTEPGEYPLVVTAEYRRNASSYQLEGPAVCVPLISSTGHGDAALHRVHYQEGKFALANLLVALIPYDSNVCNAKYLYHLLMTKKDEYFVPLMSGTANVSLKIQDIASVEIPLPPLKEQQRIVARIEELAARIEEARGLRREAVEEGENLWDSSLRTVFEQQAKDYQHTTFRDVCEVVRGGSPRPAGDPTYYDGSIPFLKVADLTADTQKYVTKYSATLKEAGLSHSRYVEPNTLMLTNSGATLGVPKIGTFGTCFNDGIQAFLNIPDNIAKEYLYYFFLSKTRWFREWAARGQGQPNLNTDMVKGLEFPLPPLKEQYHVVKYLDDLKSKADALSMLESETSAELDALLPSVLDKAFKGEL